MAYYVDDVAHLKPISKVLRLKRSDLSKLNPLRLGKLVSTYREASRRNRSYLVEVKPRASPYKLLNPCRWSSTGRRAIATLNKPSEVSSSNSDRKSVV